MSGADGAASRGPGCASAGKAAVRGPRRMWWMYFLVVSALAGMGSGAAQAWTFTRDRAGIAAVMKCLAEHGLSAGSAVGRQYAACALPFDHRQGIAMLAGAGLVPGAAWLLMLCGGLGIRWRLRRGRADSVPSVAARNAASRFGAWCDAWDLTGRRRPGLWLTAPGKRTGQAFTTGLPFGRPLVVVPLSYAYADPAVFDVVVLHELAHVRSRDLTWASSVWWAGWLSVPVLLLALLPVLGRPGLLLAEYHSALWLAAGLSAAALLLRAGLLRRRELAADRFATDVMGTPGALLSALRQETSSPAPALSQADSGYRAAMAGSLARLLWLTVRCVRALTASHPPAAIRARAGEASLNVQEGGFGVTAAAGLLAMFTFQVIYFTLTDISGLARAEPQRTLDVALAAASLLWACVVLPAWARRIDAATRAGSPPAWRGPLAGAMLGLIAGYCLRVPGVSEAAGLLLPTGHALLLTGLGIVTAGVAALAAGVAASAAGTGGPGRARALAGGVLATSAVMTAALGVMHTVVLIQMRLGSIPEDRIMVMEHGGDPAWHLMPLILLLGLALASPAASAASSLAGIRPAGRWRGAARVAGQVIPRACLPVIAAAAGAGGISAVLSWQLRFRAALPTDTLGMLVIQRYWICALAGWAAVAAVMVTGRASTQPARRVPLAELPAALNAGLVTAALSGLVMFAWPAVSGYGRDPGSLRQSLEMPTWLLFVSAVVTMPWLLLAVGLASRIRRHPQQAARTAAVVVGTGLTAGTLSIALVGGILSPVTVAPHDYQRSMAATADRTTGPVTLAIPQPPAEPLPEPGTAGDPRRSLDRAGASAALKSLPQVLGTGWTLAADAVTSPSGLMKQGLIRPASCLDLFNRDAAAGNALPRTAAISRVYTFPARGMRNGIKLTVSLQSFVTALRGFAADRNEAARCPHYTIPSIYADDGQIHASLFSGTPPRLPYPAHQVDQVFTAHQNISLQVFSSLTDSVLVGHNLISAATNYDYAVIRPQGAQRYVEDLAAAVLANIIHNLGRRPR